MTNILIRHAVISDLAALVPLMERLGYPTSKEDLKIRLTEYIENKDYGVAVACSEDRVVGWVAWSRSSFLVTDKTRFRIEGIVVDEGYRQEGIGKKLMNFIENVAKQYTPSVIEATSGLRREKDGSHEFYKSLGYRNEGYMAKLYLRKEMCGKK